MIVSLLFLAFLRPDQAAQARDARLTVTVVDATGAVIQGATVTVTGLDADTRTASPAPVKTSEKGIALVDALPAGRYRITGEFSGFETGQLADVRLRRGDNKHVVVLPLKKMEESVTVAQTAQAAAADPRGAAFKTMLTRQEIEALSDDPQEMAQQLQDMAGGNATIRVDSFSGAPLPPKAMIKSIHIVRDTFAAENHSAEAEEINIITQPGQGALRGGFASRLRDGALSARSPFVSEKGPERQQRYEGNLGGTIVENKSSFSLSVEGVNQFDTPILFAALPNGGRQSELLPIRHPMTDWSVFALVDYAVTRDQLLRLSFDHSSTRNENLGVGGQDRLERAYSTTQHDEEVRAQLVGPLGRRMFANTRLEIRSVDTDAIAAATARTIIVNGAFTSGGAQVAGGRHPKTFEAASDVDYVRGINSVRTGFQITGGNYRSDNASNMLGTFTFAGIDAFNAGTPATYTQRFGDPLVEYFNAQTALYLQDDLRVSKGLTLSPGVRYEIQTHLKDRGNVGPRIGVTWAPFRNGRTTLRVSYGQFYQWLNANTYEQTLRVDGFRQRDCFIQNPTYPDPGTCATLTTTNKYELGPDVQMGRSRRFSTGTEQALSPKVRLNAIFQSNRFVEQPRGRNLNPATNGVRPDRNFANIIETVSDGEQHVDTFATTLTVNLAGGVRNAAAPRWNARRTTFRLTYWISKATNDFDGPFVVPPSNTLATEWGPSLGDRRQRYNVSVNTQALRNLNATLSVSGNSGTPYNITTGFDDNGDSIFNDRPAGVTRNSARTAAQATVTGNLSYSMALGAPATRAQERGGDRRGDAPQAGGRYRVVVTLSVNNLVNRSNFIGYSGVQTSPFFMTPTAVLNPRKVDLGITLRF